MLPSENMLNKTAPRASPISPLPLPILVARHLVAESPPKEQAGAINLDDRIQPLPQDTYVPPWYGHGGGHRHLLPQLEWLQPREGADGEGGGYSSYFLRVRQSADVFRSLAGKGAE